MASAETHPKVGGGKAVRRRDVGGGRGGVGEVGVDVGQQVAHHGRHPWTHVLGRQAGEVPAPGQERHREAEQEGTEAEERRGEKTDAMRLQHCKYLLMAFKRGRVAHCIATAYAACYVLLLEGRRIQALSPCHAISRAKQTERLQ